MLCDHLRSHYAGVETNEVGSEIRERLFSALLSIICDPYTGQLGIFLSRLISGSCDFTTVMIGRRDYFDVLRWPGAKFIHCCEGGGEKKPEG